MNDKAKTMKPWEHAKADGGSADDPLAARFVESLSYDRRLYKHDIAGSIAHAQMLCEVGLLSNDELKQIEKGLNEIAGEIEAADGEYGASWAGWKIELEDVHMCIEAALIEKIGEAGRKLHTGRSRNDQVAADLKLWLNEAADQLDKLFGNLFKAFVELAKRDGLVVMPSYTHLQRAQPIVAGAELLAWAEALRRAQKRVQALVEVNLQNPLGSGAIAGSSLPLDRKVTAELMGIGEPTVNSIDATASRDAAVDFAYGLAMTAMTLSRWAEQWILYASTEFGFLKLDHRYTTGSSMMPQKRNPDMLELIRGRAGTVYGQLTALLVMCKGITIGYNRDLQEDKRCLFAAFDTVCDCLDMASRIVSTSKFNEEKITEDIDKGFADATSLAEYLVNQGVAFRTAHQIVGRLVGECESRGLTSLIELAVDDFNKACSDAGVDGATCSEDVYEWLGAANVVKRYCSSGNGGESGFKEQLARWEALLAE